MDPEMTGAACHEAAHAVVAAVLGASIVGVSIRSDGEGWEGDAPAHMGGEPGPERTRKSWKVAVAGPLGQAKGRARLRWPDASFDREAPLEEWVPVIREGDLEAGRRLGLWFVGGSERRRLEIQDYNDFGDFEMLTNLSADMDDEELVGLLRDVQGMVDAAGVWAAIEEITAVVCARGAVSGEEAHAVVRRHCGTR